MGWRGLLLFFLSVLLFLTASVSVIGLSSLTLLNSNTYLPYFEKHGIYTQVEGLLERAPNLPFVELPEENTTLLVEKSFRSIFDYLNGESETVNITIQVNGDELREFFRTRVAELPVCSKGWQDNGTITCRPSNETVTMFTERVLEDHNLTILDSGEINLGEQMLADGNLAKVRDRIAVYKKVVYWFAFASILLIAIILLIGWNTERYGLRSVGIPLFVSGALVFTAFYTGSALMQNAFSSFLPKLEGFNLTSLVIDVLGGIKSQFMMNSIILSLSGVALIVCSFIFKRKEGK